MPLPTIDVNKVADAVTGVLDRRAHEAQLASDQAEREAAIRAQREADEASEAARVARQATLNQLALLENAERGVTRDLKVKSSQYGALGKEIDALSGQHNFLLMQLHQMKKQLGI